MNTLSIDFVYFHKPSEVEIVVEVEASINKAVPNPDSDWDGKNYTEILSVTAYHDGEVIDVDIPKAVVDAEIQASVRDALLVVNFSQEGGGF